MVLTALNLLLLDSFSITIALSVTGSILLVFLMCLWACTNAWLGIGIYFTVYGILYMAKTSPYLSAGYYEFPLAIPASIFKLTLLYFLGFLIALITIAVSFRLLLNRPLRALEQSRLIPQNRSMLLQTIVLFSGIVFLGVFQEGSYSLYFDVSMTERAKGGFQFGKLYALTLAINLIVFGDHLLMRFVANKKIKWIEPVWFGAVVSLTLIYNSRRLMLFVGVTLFIKYLILAGQHRKRLGSRMVIMSTVLVLTFAFSATILRDTLKSSYSFDSFLSQLNQDVSTTGTAEINEAAKVMKNRLAYFTTDAFILNMVENGFSVTNNVTDMLLAGLAQQIPALVFPEKYKYSDARLSCDTYLNFFTLKDNSCTIFNTVMVFPSAVTKLTVLVFYALAIAIGCALFCSANLFLFSMGSVFLWTVCMQIEMSVVFPILDGLRALIMFSVFLLLIYWALQLVSESSQKHLR